MQATTFKKTGARHPLWKEPWQSTTDVHRNHQHSTLHSSGSIMPPWHLLGSCLTEKSMCLPCKIGQPQTTFSWPSGHDNSSSLRSESHTLQSKWRQHSLDFLEAERPHGETMYVIPFLLCRERGENLGWPKSTFVLVPVYVHAYLFYVHIHAFVCLATCGHRYCLKVCCID